MKTYAAKVALVAALFLALGAQAAVLYKDSSTDSLNSTTSWWTTEAGTTDPTSIGTSDTLWFGGSGQAASMTGLSLGGNLTVGTIRLDNITGTPNYNVSIAAGNTLTLNGNNDYNAGYLSGIVLNSGTGGTLTINADIAIGASQKWVASRNLTVNGNVSLGANTLSLYTAGGTTAITGAISGTGGISRTDSSGGTAVLYGSNSYTGATTVTTGALTNYGTHTNAGAYTVNGGTLNNYGTITSTGAFSLTSGTLSSYGSTTTSSTLSINGGSLVVYSGGTFTAGAATSGSTSSGINVNAAGTLTLSSLTCSYTPSTYTIDGTLNVSGTLTSSWAATKTIGGTGTINVGGYFNDNYSNITFGALRLNLGSSGFTQSRPGSVTFNGTTIGAKGANWSSSVPFTLTGTDTFNTLDSADGTTARTITLSGILSSTGALTKTGSGTLTLSGANTYTGATTVTGGTLTISGSPTGNSAITVKGGTLALNYGTNNTSKINDSAVLTLSGGALSLTGGTHTEVVSSTTIGSGYTSLTRPSGTSVLQMGTITRTAPGFVDFSVASMATTSNTNTNGILGNWATVGGANWAVNSTNGANGSITAYSSYTDVSRLGGTIADGSTTHVRITESGSSGNVTLAAAGTTTINTLLQGASGGTATVDIGAGNILRLGAAGGILLPTSNSALNITSGTLTAGGADNTAGEIAITNYSASNSVTIGSVIANNGTGAVTLVKGDSGKLALTGTNTYSGGTKLGSGTLNLGAAGALGTGTLALTGGTIDNTSGGSMTLSNNIAQSWNGDFTFAGSNALNLGTGAVTLSGNNTATVSASTLTVGGVISGAYSLTKAGAGTLTLTGKNTYSEGTTISGGTLKLSGTGSLYSSVHTTKVVTINSGGTLELDSFSYVTNGGSGSLGMLADYGNYRILNGGTINVVGNTHSSGNDFYVPNGSTGAFNMATSGQTLTLSGNANTNIAVGGTLTFGGAGNITVNEVIENNTGVGSVVYAGSGTLTLGAANTFSGSLSATSGTVVVSSTLRSVSGVTANAGSTIKLNTTNMFVGGHGSPVSNTVILKANGGTLVLDSSMVSRVGNITLSNGGTLTSNSAVTGYDVLLADTTMGAATVKVDGTAASAALMNGTGGIHLQGVQNFNVADITLSSAADLTVSMKLADPVSSGGAAGGILKYGAGTMELSGSNSFAGNVTIREGTIIAKNSSALGTGGTVILNDAVTGSSNTGLYLDSLTISRPITIANQGSGTTTLGSNGSAALSVFSGAITLAKDVTLNGSTNTDRLTFTGGIGGSGNVIVTGNRVAFDSTANTYAGTTTINSGGTLQLGVGFSVSASLLPDTYGVSVAGTLKLAKAGNTEAIGGLSGAGVVEAISGSDTLSVGGGDATATFSGVLRNNGATLSLIKTGAGTQTLSGTNTYTGGTTITGGTLALGHATDTLSNTGAINVNGGTLDIAGNNDTVGAVTLTTGSITGSGGTLTGSSFAVQSGTVSAKLGGSGIALTKSTGGTVTLSGVNTYTGATSADAGTLNITGSLASGSTVTVASGAILTGSGTVGAVGVTGTMTGTLTGGAVTVNNGGVLTPGTSGSGFLTMSSLTLGATGGDTATINIGITGLPGSAVTSSSLQVNGNVTANGGVGSATFDFGASLAFLANGTYHLVNYTGTQLSDVNAFAWSGTKGARQTPTLVNGTNAIDLNITAAWPIWTGATSSDWSAGTGNWKLNSDASDTYFMASDTVHFDSTASSGTVNLTSDVAPVSVTFEGDSLNYTLGSTGGFKITSGLMAKSGASTVTINNANTFDGGTTIAGGKLVLGDGGALGSGSVTLTSGTLDINGKTIANGIVLSGGALAGNGGTINGVVEGTGSLTVGSSLALTGVNTYSGATTISAGALEISGGGQLGSGTYAQGISNAGTLKINSSANQTLSGAITGTGALVKAGAGTLTLSGSNDYSGGTALSEGTLVVTDASSLGASSGGLTFAGSSTLRLNGSVSSSRAYVINDGVSATMDTNGNSLSVGGNVSGAGALVKSGAGALTLSGSNSYGGGTTLSAGTLNINSATALGTGALTISGGTIDNNSGGALTLTNNNAQNWNGDFTFTGTQNLNLGTGAVAMSASRRVTVSSGTLTVGGVISGDSSTLTKAGSGTLTLSGSNSYTGGTSIVGGAISVTSIADGSASGLGAGSGTTGYIGIKNATLQYTGTGSQTSTRYLWIDQGTGTIDITNASATLTLNPGGGTRSQNFTKMGVGALVLGGAISGTATVTVSGGALTLTATNTSTGAATIGSGSTLEIAGSGSLNSGSYAANISNSGTLKYNSSANQTLSGVISGTGAFTKDGSGDLTLSAANTYNGTTTVNGGKLIVLGGANTANGGLASPSIVINNGGTLEVGGQDTLGYTVSRNALTINSGGTVTIASGVRATVANTINMTGGTLTGVGNGDVWGNFSLFSGAGITATSDASGNAATISAAKLALQDSSSQTTFNVTRGSASPTTDLNVTGAIVTMNGSTNGLIKSGNGIMTMSGTNTYAGNTTVSAGTLILAGGSSIVDSTTVTLANTAGATLQLTANETIGNLSGGGLTGGNVNLQSCTLTIGAGGGSNYTGSISGTGGVTMTGANGFLFGGTQSYSGTTDIQSGYLEVSGAALNIANSVLNVTSSTALRAVDIWAGKLTIRGLTGTGIIVANGSNGNKFSGTALELATQTGDTFTFSGTLKNTSWESGGVMSIEKTGAGTQVLTGANAYTGGTIISAGTLELGHNQGLGTGAVTLNGGTLNIGGYTVANNIVLGGGTLAFNGATINGNISETGGSRGLTINNNVKLAGANTYTGATSIVAGMVELTGSLADTAVTVDAGATLKNTGTIGGSVTASGTITGNGGTFAGGLILASGAVHAPGSSPGTQIVAGTLEYSGSTLVIDIWTDALGVAGTDFDQITIGGTSPTLNLLNSPNIVVNLNGTYNPEPGNTYKIIDGFTARTGTFNSVVTVQGASEAWTSSGNTFSIAYNANDITLTVIPEPGTAGVVATFLAAALFRRRRFK